MGERVEAMDLLSLPRAYARLHQRLVESHVMDFLVRRQSRPRKRVDHRAPVRFLAELAQGTEASHDSPGLGTDHRLRFRWAFGSALRVEETIVHLALFGGSGLGKDDRLSEPPLRRRMRWW